MIQIGAHHPTSMAVVGTVLVMIGATFWAKYKGRHLAFGLLAAAPLVGLVLIGFLDDRLAKKWSLPQP